MTNNSPGKDSGTLDEIGPQLRVGDIVFTRVGPRLFRQVSDASGCWTNHVGIVIEEGSDPLVAESCVPLSRTTHLSRFVARSVEGRTAVCRLHMQLDEASRTAIPHAARKRLGRLYHTGFNLHSRRQFCSKFVHEVVEEATGITLGRIERFAELLQSNPQADQKFWRWWFFGRIPWQRETITPASLLYCAHLHDVFNGHLRHH